MTTSTVQKWGNSLGIRLPKAVADQLNITQGAEIRLTIEDGRVVITPLDAEVPSLAELLKKMKRGSRPPLEDWGNPVGKEVW